MSDNARQIAVLERMLANEATLSRLPDKGDALRARLAALQAASAPQQAAADDVPEAPVAPTAAATSSSVRGTDGGLSAAERMRAHAEEGERTRHVEPDVKNAFAASFKGVLSRREIAKLVVASGATRGNFASWDETQRMLAADREREREQELARLRRLTAPSASNGAVATAPAARGMSQLMAAFEALPAP